MKRIYSYIMLVFTILLPAYVCAYGTNASVLQERLTAVIFSKSAEGIDAYLSAPDAYGTPLIIQLARQGDVKTLLRLAQTPAKGKFLGATDKYGNNIFHVAKNAETIQALAVLVRRFYPATTQKNIQYLVNQQNQLGETPLFAQINAGHADTFLPIYRYTALKTKNDAARTHLSRLQGMDPAIIAQHQAIYCAEVFSAGTANGMTLLQAAQAQVPYNAQMAEVVQHIKRLLPCLENPSRI